MNAQHYAAENQENKFKILRQNELSSPSVSRTPSPKTLVPKHRHSLKYSGGSLHDDLQEPLEFDHTFDNTTAACHSGFVSRLNVNAGDYRI